MTALLAQVGSRKDAVEEATYGGGRAMDVIAKHRNSERMVLVRAGPEGPPELDPKNCPFVNFDVVSKWDTNHTS